MSIPESSVVAAGTVLLVLQAALTWSLLRALGRLGPMADKVSQFADALSLLTETAETGFKATALELQRLGTRTERRADTTGSSTTARVAAAARRGKSLQEIAAHERLSEGEVRLRLNMSEQAKAADKASTRKPAKPTSSATLNGHAAVVAKAVRKVREARARNHGSVRS
jgi:hypothetical protein